MSCRILVVEDSATQAEALRALLADEGNEVVVARSAEAALECVASEPFDVVLSDVVMPGISGFDLCRRLKGGAESRELPVVLLTSLSDPMDIVRGLECGADNYITKPYDPEHLLARVRHVLDNRRLRRGAKTTLGVNVRFLGKELAITSDREQILDLFISSVEDVVRTNEALQRSQRELAEAHAKLETYAAEKAREARVSEARYRALLQNAGDAILVLDGRGRILEGNPRAADLLGLPVGELPSQALIELLPSEGLEEFSERFGRLAFERQVVLGERVFIDGSGRETWCELTASCTRLGAEELVLLIARDVTARKRNERELSATTARLEALIEGSPLAILVHDPAGRIELWNPAAERIFGWTANEAIGHPPPFVPPDQMDAYMNAVRRVLGGEPLVGMEVSRVRKDGSPVEVGIYAAQLRAPNGEPVGVLSMIADLTERRQAEQAVCDGAEADRANRAKSEFLSRMSHELRTPLNAVLGFAQLLDMGDLPAEHSESVEQILRAGRHLLELIDEVLDLSRIEAGKLSVSLEPVSLHAVVDEVLCMMAPLAAQHGLTLQADLGEECDSFIRADMQRLKQVLLNFVSNAVKFNRPGGRVMLSTSGRDGVLRIAVEDTGSGIAAGELERLFVPFERLGADSKGIQGTGLGLMLARGLAEAMGGEIGVESRPGEGSTFWIELSSVASPVLETLDSHSTREGAGAPRRVEPRTILYIEDNPSNLRLVERILSTRPEIRLLTAMQGSLGLDLAEEHLPDLLLLDLNLPDLTAEEILARLGEHPVLRDTPVVVISADAMPGQVQRMLQAGAREYLTKPIDVKRFLETVDECLAGNRTSSRD